MKDSLTYRLIYCLALFIPFSAFGRVVVSQSTGEPIIYASVGIVNRNLGTVTDSAGYFSLSVPPEYAGDSLRISSLGYVAQTFAVKDFRAVPDTIKLADDAILLADVVVKPQKVVHKTAGNRSGSGFIYIEVERDRAAGQGIAVPLKVDKRAWLKEIGFVVVVDDYTVPRMKFRVNIYAKAGDSYRPLTSVRQHYFDYDRDALVDGRFSYTFPEEITLEKGEYYVELEFLENFSNALFLMKTRPMTGRTRYRYASQSDWETMPFGAPIYVEYDTLK